MKVIIKKILQTKLGNLIVKQLLAAFYLAVLTYLMEKIKKPVDPSDPLTRLDVSDSGNLANVSRFFQVATADVYVKEFTDRFLDSNHLNDL